MRAIQSFWFAPLLQPKSRLVAGFNSAEEFLIAWAYSAMLLREQFSELAFFSDERGCALAADLGLPYSLIEDSLRDFDASPLFWNAGKLEVYSKQRQPFVHFDLDFFLLRPLPDDLLASDVCAQHLEAEPAERHFYRDAAKGLRGLPRCPKFCLEGQDAFSAVNCGLFGGRNLTVLRDYSTACLESLLNHENLEAWGRLSLANSGQLWKFSVAIEQLGARMLFLNASLRSAVLSSTSPAACDTAREYGFLHLVGHQKSDRHIMSMVSAEVVERAPKTYAAIQKAAKRISAS